MLLTNKVEIKQDPDTINEQRKQSEHQISVESSLTKSDLTYKKQLEHVMFHEEMFKFKQEKVKTNSHVINADAFNTYSVCDTPENSHSLRINTGLTSKAGEPITQRFVHYCLFKLLILKHFKIGSLGTQAI